MAVFRGRTARIRATSIEETGARAIRTGRISGRVRTRAGIMPISKRDFLCDDSATTGSIGTEEIRADMYNER